MSHDQDEWERANNDFLGVVAKEPGKTPQMSRITVAR